ncbi:hypothetical protein [Rhizobium sp.]
MILTVTSDGAIALLERDDFRRLKFALPPGARVPAHEDIAILDADHILISRELIPNLTPTADPAWLSSYEAMIDTATRYGWVDKTTQRIKVHIEREP